MRNHDQFKEELYRRRDAHLRRRGIRSRVLTACISLLLVSGIALGAFYAPEAGQPENGPMTVHAANLMDGLRESAIEGTPSDDVFIRSQMDFSLKLFQAVQTGDNSLISPLSVSLALAMTANGADEETLADMEAALGGLSIQDLNNYLCYYVNHLPSSEKSKLSYANAIWFKNNKSQFIPNQDFLQTALDYYRADAYAVPFDQSTLQDINSWISRNTDGMINNALERIDPYAVMYLVNTVLFDGEWLTPYTERSIQDDTFTSAAGKEQSISMMHSTEHCYLEDANAVGFIKDYAEGYRFVALLPNEGITVEEYIDTLTADDLLALLERPYQRTVYAGLPKFQYDSSYELSKALTSMGMGSAFRDDADFSKMGTTDTGKLFLSRVIHKTHIAVDGMGTKAGAVTVVETVRATGALTNTVTVQLDRPFVYLIIDSESNLPIFMGAVTDLS